MLAFGTWWMFRLSLDASAAGVLDEADSSERKEGFGGIRVEQRLHSMKSNIGGGSWVLGG